MQDATKEQVMKVIDILKKCGDKGKRREEFPNELQNAITVAIQKDLIHRQNKKWKRWFGRDLYSIWLKLGPGIKPDPTKIKTTSTAPVQQQQQEKPTYDEIVADRNRQQFLDKKKKFWKLASQLPAHNEIWKRLEAIPEGDKRALLTLWQNVWDYYELGPITSEVYAVPSREELMRRIAERKKKQGLNPDNSRQTSGTFALDRGDFRKKVKELLAQGVITDKTCTYIQDKINAIALDNTQELEALRQKVYQYYNLNPDSEA